MWITGTMPDASLFTPKFLHFPFMNGIKKYDNILVIFFIKCAII